MTSKKTPLLLRLRVVIPLIIALAALHVFSLINENISNEQYQSKEYSFQIEKILSNELYEIQKLQIEIGKLLEQGDSLDVFDSVAATVLKANNSINAIELAPQGIIQYIYPISDHYLIAGYNIVNDESQYDNVIYSLKTGKPHFVGPIELRQGGQAIISRLPVFDNEGFIGFSIILIDPEILLSKSISKTTHTSSIELSLSSELKEDETCTQQALSTNEKSIYLNSCYKNQDFKYKGTSKRIIGWLTTCFVAFVLVLFIRKKYVLN